MILAPRAEIPPGAWLTVGVLFVAVVAFAGPEITERFRAWKARGCAGCLVNHMNGGGWSLTPHTCSRKQTLYVDGRGRRWQAGKLVRSA